MFQDFFHAQAAGGIVLLICAVIALVWANSASAESYFELWETPVGLGVGGWDLTLSLHHLINDGLMAIFFFMVGLEIKRELLIGELSSLRKAALPIMAALGGMIVPALIYMAFNFGTPGSRGWGIPMATDIAFSLGVLALLGTRVPTGLKVFLAALAIADDLGAVLVIALFYTGTINIAALGLATLIVVVMVIMNQRRIYKIAPYAAAAILLWYVFLHTGVHATIAGVLAAATVPARTRIDLRSFVQRTRQLVATIEAPEEPRRGGMSSVDRDAILDIERNCERVQSPLSRMEHGLSDWVGFVVMPVFALANAGVAFQVNPLVVLAHPVAMGAAFGLVVGKQVGVMLFSWLAVQAGFAMLPDGVDWRKLYGVAWLCGIGFTMSLFVSGLAFEDPGLLDAAKAGVFAGSFVSGLTGWLILSRASVFNRRHQH